jgi:hypothetical protein
MTQETMQRHMCKNTLSAMMQLTKGRQMNITSIAKQWDIVYKNKVISQKTSH